MNLWVRLNGKGGQNYPTLPYIYKEECINLHTEINNLAFLVGEISISLYNPTCQMLWSLFVLFVCLFVCLLVSFVSFCFI